MSADRAAGILARFTAAQTTLLTRLREMPPGAAQEQADPEHWSAAQLGCHVALTNELIASVITGVKPMAEPAPPDFRETFSGTTSGMVKVFPTLQPPGIVGRDAALERLRLSGQRMCKAIASLTPERGSGFVVALPFGTLSLFELADYTASHVARHASYVERPVVRA
jgi:DinB superfamily